MANFTRAGVDELPAAVKEYVADLLATDALTPEEKQAQVDTLSQIGAELAKPDPNSRR